MLRRTAHTTVAIGRYAASLVVTVTLLNQPFHESITCGSIVKRTHVVALDLIRFLAALAVVLYHYTAFDFKTLAAPVTQYGFLGVPLFFLISGFVIALSLNTAASPASFLANRAIRLYPAFFICSLITVGYVAAFTDGPYFSAYDLLANMTMFGELLHARLINPAYWSLAVEWMFYFMMFGLFLIVGRTRLQAFLWCWIAASGLSIFQDFGIVGRLLVLHNAPYFVGGASLYLMSSEGAPNRGWLGMLCLISLPIAIYWELQRAVGVGLSGALDRTVVALAVIGFYAILAMVAKSQRAVSSPKMLAIAGRASYPLYLLHETIGIHVLRTYYEPGIAGASLVIGLVLGMIAVAGLIGEYIERPAIDFLKRASTRLGIATQG